MTKIEWTHRAGTKGETWNPIRARNKATGGVGHFCTKVSKGCDNCYAANFQKRFKNPIRYAKQDTDQVEIFLDETVLTQPLRWKKPRSIFACSMTDIFHEAHQYDWMHKILAVAALCPQHTFIILTKRPEAAFEKLSEDEDAAYEIAIEAADIIPPGYDLTDIHMTLECGEWRLKSWPLPNVWLGVSVEDQGTAIKRIPILLETPAAVRFISAEPLLGAVNIESWIGLAICASTYQTANEEFYRCDMTGNPCEGISWVIVGGESGHNARPMHPDWARQLRDQCKAAGVPFFFKQWGAWSSKRGEGNHECQIVWPSHDAGSGGTIMARVGKKAAGREIDGIQHLSLIHI